MGSISKRDKKIRAIETYTRRKRKGITRGEKGKGTSYWLVLLKNITLIIELKAKVADNEVCITKLLEEKTQAEEQKQIITGWCIISIHDIR